MAQRRGPLLDLVEPYRQPMSGAEMRQLRRRAGCTQTDLADVLGVHHITISCYERGIYPISQGDTILLRLLANRLAGR
jgi:transcriptional regulator with XRE-family HTH domain